MCVIRSSGRRNWLKNSRIGASMLQLSLQLLKLFAEGVLPATSVQILAGAALADGWGVGDGVAEKLARLGASGKHPNNVLRDLVRLSKCLGIAEVMPEPYVVQVPGKAGTFRPVSVILPHEQVHMTVLKVQCFCLVLVVIRYRLLVCSRQKS